MNDTRSIDIAIVGGGFTGAAVAYHLARLTQDASIAVFEPRDFLGGGLAYDDLDPAHRINVPATRMSLFPQDEGHFARWLAETGAGGDDPGISGRDGFIYPRRGVFGRYVGRHLDPLVAAGRIAHIKSAVQSIEQSNGVWRLTAASGEPVRARFVVLATTHPAPEAPTPLKALASDPRVIADALVPGALSGIARDARVVILGTGLTMADVVASLDRQGHRGSIIALSRRGLRSRGHPSVPSEPFGDFNNASPSASALLRKIGRTIREARAAGRSWHGVIDAVRAHAQTFWPALSPQDQSRIVRHLRVYWDVHRFRIAPQVEDVLDHRIAAGSLRVLAASLLRAESRAHHLDLTIRRRRRGDIETLEADHVVVTTGPAHSKILSTQPYLAGLADRGQIKADHLGLGIACDAESRALDTAEHPQPTLFIAGPLARARFGELMGLPQVSAHALRVAEEVARSLSDAHKTTDGATGDLATAK